jgi:hypothetical protein
VINHLNKSTNFKKKGSGAEKTVCTFSVVDKIVQNAIDGAN